MISIPKVVRLSSEFDHRLNFRQNYFNPKSGSIKFRGLRKILPAFLYFNPKSGSIKFNEGLKHCKENSIFQSQKWFD